LRPVGLPEIERDGVEGMRARPHISLKIGLPLRAALPKLPRKTGAPARR